MKRSLSDLWSDITEENTSVHVEPYVFLRRRNHRVYLGCQVVIDGKNNARQIRVTNPLAVIQWLPAIRKTRDQFLAERERRVDIDAGYADPVTVAFLEAKRKEYAEAQKDKAKLEAERIAKTSAAARRDVQAVIERFTRKQEHFGYYNVFGQLATILIY